MNPVDALSTPDTALAVKTSSTVSASVPKTLLEDRVQRLEDAVALLTHHVQWDESVTTAVEPVARISHEPLPDPLAAKPAPRAMPIPSPPTASLAEFAMPSYAEPKVARVSSLSSVLQPIQSALPLATSTVNRILPASSLWRDLWWDVRTAWRMVRDPYYPMSTACKVVPLFALFYVTVWPWFSAWSGIVGTVMNYLVNAIVIYIAFKVIQRELRRYYEFAEKYRR
ncbi:MAG TPA: hypothetical protein PLN21_14970 [Gemmatales bacterium]|nr:hypothetical protein [Gemmatales bacterium]